MSPLFTVRLKRVNIQYIYILYIRYFLHQTLLVRGDPWLYFGGQGALSLQGEAAHPLQHPVGSCGAGEGGGCPSLEGRGRQGQGELMLRALPAPLWGLDGAGKALFFTAPLKYRLKFEILRPLWDLWKWLPVQGDPLQRARGSPLALLHQGTKPGPGRSCCRGREMPGLQGEPRVTQPHGALGADGHQTGSEQVPGCYSQ